MDTATIASHLDAGPDDTFTGEKIEITGYNSIPDLDAGFANLPHFANSTEVITYLNNNVTSATISGYSATVAITGWAVTADGYATSSAASYTFEGTLDTANLPNIYIDDLHPISKVPVEVVIKTLPTPPEGYEKVWEDHFDGSTLNNDNWSIGMRDSESGDLIPGARGDSLLNSAYAGYTTPEDVIVANGTLSLLNQKRDITGTSPAGNYSYTSGWVNSMHKLHTNKGYLEWRAKFPTGDKVWPALWLISEDLVWGPEWDCFEYFGYRSDVGYDAMGMHLMRGEYPTQLWSSHFGKSFFSSSYNPDHWHIYAFEWTESYAKWYVDGVEVHHLDNTFGTGANGWPDEEMYIVMNNGVKSDSPDTNTVWPNNLAIDYVKLYQKPQPVSITVNNHSFEANGEGKQPGTTPAEWATDSAAAGYEAVKNQSTK